jgi:hypothetical protein
VEAFSYSEAGRKLCTVLDEAESMGKVFIRRRDGRTDSLVPERMPSSSQDVPSVNANVSTQEVVELIRRERGKERGMRRTSRQPPGMYSKPGMPGASPGVGIQATFTC